MEAATLEDAATDEEDNAIGEAIRAATLVGHAAPTNEDLMEKPLYRCSLQEVRQIATQLGFDLRSPTLRTWAQIEAAIELPLAYSQTCVRNTSQKIKPAEQLRQELQRRGLETTGTVDEMRLRLQGCTPPAHTSTPQPAQVNIHIHGASSNAEMASGPECRTEVRCPQCGMPMRPRQNRQDHGWFWGCSRFPTCQATRPMGPAVAASMAMLRRPVTPPAISSPPTGLNTPRDPPGGDLNVADLRAQVRFLRLHGTDGDRMDLF